MSSVVPALILCPFSLRVETIAAFVNAEFADHPVYDGVEVQRFDDDVHGRGILAFLSRRDSRRVDYYATPGLRLDRTSYELGGGTGGWYETSFDAGVLEVTSEGIRADVRFVDRDGRRVGIDLDDRAAGSRRPGELLAPVGAGIDAPVSLGLVLLTGFDLLRRTSHEPRILIDGEVVDIGTLPGAPLHRRHLIKAAGPLVVASICPATTGPMDPVDPAMPGPVVVTAEGAIAGVVAHHGERTADLRLDPPLPPLAALDDGASVTGGWSAHVAERPITGGWWRTTRVGDEVALQLDVTEPWRPPARLPLLLRVVTRVVPVFRRWPTTYRWRAEVRLGATPSLASRWERTGDDRGAGYRRVTRSDRPAPIVPS